MPSLVENFSFFQLKEFEATIENGTGSQSETVAKIHHFSIPLAYSHEIDML